MLFDYRKQTNPFFAAAADNESSDRDMGNVEVHREPSNARDDRAEPYTPSPSPPQPANPGPSGGGTMGHETGHVAQQPSPNSHYDD